ELAHSISIEEPRSQQRRRSRLTIDRQTDEAIANMYNEWGQKLKGPTVKDPIVQSMLDLRKGSKANKLKSLRQKKQPVARDYVAARYGVFLHNKSTTIPNSTYLGSTVTSSSLDFIQTLLDETLTNELTDFISHPVYTNAQTTSVVHNPEGNYKLTSYISGATKVPLGTHVDVLATKTLMQEMFPNMNAHHIPSH
ncbi:hypothetical protein Tco_0225185, partial [Tanacetum coccineum]